MKFTAKHVLCAEILSWILICLPFFVPALNSIEPRVIGLPFIVFYDVVIIALHTVLLVAAKRFTWDTFDADLKEDDPAGQMNSEEKVGNK